MARSALNDPLTKFAWSVDIPGFTRAAFSSMSMPSYMITPKTYAEGGQHWAPKSIPDKFEYQPIKLERGVTNDTSFSKWAASMIDVYTNGKAAANSSSTKLFGAIPSSMNAINSEFNGENINYRKDIRIDHVNRAGQVEVSYFIYGAYPISYRPGSDFDAMADDGVSIDSLTLGYDSFEVKYSGLKGFLGNLAADILI